MSQTRLCEYEYVFREVFKYRKNLSADDWRLSIGPRIARRKAAGKRSEVLLNNSRVENVDRKVQRALRSKSSRRCAKGQKQSIWSEISCHVYHADSPKTMLHRCPLAWLSEPRRRPQSSPPSHPLVFHLAGTLGHPVLNNSRSLRPSQITLQAMKLNWLVSAL